MKKKNAKAFDVLISWNECAWIAETISDDFWYMSQGETPKVAIDRLKSGLAATANYRINHGFEPFSRSVNNGGLSTPERSVRRFRLASALPAPRALVKGKDYRYIVIVHWSLTKV